ncbi:MAG: ABC transporter substrate-binding protein [Burkholderiaceae bacterium]
MNKRIDAAAHGFERRHALRGAEARRSGTMLVWAAAAAATLTLAGAAAAQSGTLRTALNADIRSTDPGVNRDANTDAVIAHVVEGLVAFREDASVGPLLAETVELSPDGKAYTFKLRSGVRFHNGAALGAQDVLWAWKRFMDPATQWRCLSEFDGRGQAKLEAVEAPDSSTVVFRFDKPSALVLTNMARADCGGSGIVHKDSLGPDGKWQAPIGTGPFKLGEWRKGQFIELQRFDGYVGRSGPRDGNTGGKQALVDKVRFVIIPDAAAAKAALVSGAVDIVPDLSASDLAELRRNPALAIELAPTMNLNGILFQTKDPLLQDVRVRRAIALAIDSAQIVEAITQGTSKLNHSPIPLASSYYGPVQAKGFTPDPAAARKLLAEAGYKGQPIKLLANKRYQSTFDAAVLAQGMAQQAGLRIEIEVVDWATQLDRYNKGDYQAMSFPYSARLDPALSFEMLSGPKARQPRKVWDSPEAQQLLAEAMVVNDRAKRQALIDKLHEKFIEDVPMIVLYNGTDIVGYRKSVSGYKPWATAQPRFWGVKLN